LSFWRDHSPASHPQSLGEAKQGLNFREFSENFTSMEFLFCLAVITAALGTRSSPKHELFDMVFPLLFVALVLSGAAGKTDAGYSFGNVSTAFMALVTGGMVGIGIGRWLFHRQEKADAPRVEEATRILGVANRRRVDMGLDPLPLVGGKPGDPIPIAPKEFIKPEDS